MILFIIHFLLSNINKKTCHSLNFQKLISIIFYLLSVFEIYFYFNILRKNKYIMEKMYHFNHALLIVLIIFDLLFNGIVLIEVFSILNLFNSNKISNQEENVLNQNKIYNISQNNDIKEICPICYQDSNEYYIYHFINSFEEEYKYGCLKKSHFVCIECAKNKNLNLNVCVMCRHDI